MSDELDELITEAGFDPNVCEDSKPLAIWLEGNGFEFVGFDDPFRDAGIWHDGERVLECSVMMHGWIIEKLAYFMDRDPIDVINEIAVIAHVIEETHE